MARHLTALLIGGLTACHALAAAQGQPTGVPGTGTVAAPAPAPAPDPAPDPAPVTAPVTASSPTGATAQPDDNPAAADAADAANAVVRWQLRIEAPAGLRSLLEKHLDLVRFEQLASDERITQVELDRLIAAAPAQARSLLQTEGYFSPEVKIERQGAKAADATAAASPAPTVQNLVLRVTPGQQTVIQRTRLEFEGALSVAADAGQPDAVRLVERTRRNWLLDDGDPFTQATWGEAKNGVIARLRARGYTAATFSGSSAQIDAATHTAQLFLVADSGPLYRFGATRIEGLSHVREVDVRHLLNFGPGDPVQEQTLLDLQDRLIKTTLFDGVAVTVEPDEDQPEATPVLVKLKERSLHQSTLGLGVSDNTGPRVTLEQLTQSVFGLAWQAKAKLQYARTEQLVSLDLLSHPQPGPYRNLISGSLVNTQASGLEVSSQKVRLGRTQDIERIERLIYAEGLRDITQPADGGAKDSISALSLNYQLVWRDLDSPLLPTQGSSMTALVGGGRSFHQNDDSGYFSRVSVRLTHYWTPGKNWYAQARLQVGQVFTPESVTLPYTLLFRAGGDDSVRGYDYQTIGPRSAAGVALGGRVLSTASVELARPISLAMPSLWGATFVDAGDAALRWNDLKPKLGYGVGLRWRSPVGALKLDLAYGQDVRKFRLHFTVGVTF